MFDDCLSGFSPFLSRAADDSLFSVVCLSLVINSKLRDPRLARLRGDCEVKEGESDMDVSAIGHFMS